MNATPESLDLDRIIRHGLPFPDGVHLVDSPHQGEPVVIGEAERDLAFLDGAWRDVRLPLEKARFPGEFVVQVDQPLISSTGRVFLSSGTPLKSRGFGSANLRNDIYDHTSPPLSLDGAYNAVTMGASAYGHWLLHRLARLDSLLSVDRTLPVLSTAGSWNDTTLFDRFGIDAASLVRLPRGSSQLAKVDSVRLATHAAPPARSRVIDSNRMRRAIKNFEAGVSVPAGSPQQIYISRREASGRRIGCANTAELEQEFARRGFTIVFPEDHSIDEQIGLFRGARIVAAEMGSGAHNTVFSPAGTTVIYLTPAAGTYGREYRPEDKSWMRAIADMNHHSFHQLICTDTAVRRHWVADLAIVRTALDALEADGTI